MKCSIVYLKPHGAGGFKPDLRSDTLWAAICWAIRMVYDEKTLVDVLSAYKESNSDKAFYISSVFTYKEMEGDKLHFFPAPLLPFRQVETVINRNEKVNDIKLAARKEKSRQKLARTIAKSHLQYIIGGGHDEIPGIPPPKLERRPMTHNTIDRLTGSTITLNGSGQLFHTNEQFLKGEESGLFFLVNGNSKIIEPALRFLEHEGIGGDRSTGKGRFVIDRPRDFEITTPADPNAVMTLSFFQPTEEELAYWTNSKDRLLNYQLEDRRGRIYFQMKNNYRHEKPVMAFREGSVFSIIPGHAIYGQNSITGQHDAGFDMYRYGYGFMLPVKIL